FDSIIYDPTPGFVASTVYPTAWYKGWTNVSVDLSTYAGRTVTMKFFAAACSDGGHWGYAYIDLADLFETYARLPFHATSVTMAGPAGYSSYRWTDSATFGTTYGTTASVTIPAPAVKTKYALILTPASGHGTVDTIYKTIDVTPLGLSNPSLNTGFNLYPNPTSGAVKIQWTNQQTGTAAMEITDVTGRIVYRSALNLDAATGEQQINLGKVADGIYSITIKSDIINYTGKINVQK
ncbi:MAG: T9SS type A sorting domain-containing protein, partial [Taibaiella sp.]|nr:T9SS type A sorting domain-containing protein [Taibaiella sp.]